MLPQTFSAASTRPTRSDEFEVDPDEVDPPPHPAATAAMSASPVNRPAALRVMEGSLDGNGSHYKNCPRSVRLRTAAPVPLPMPCARPPRPRPGGRPHHRALRGPREGPAIPGGPGG